MRNHVPRRGRTSYGFTLIELVVTVAIVGVLASIALPLVELEHQRKKDQELAHALRQIRDALDAYKQAVDEGRMLKAPGESGYPKSLESLIEGVRDARDPHGGKIYFLRRLPRDPMAKPETSAAQSWGLRSYASEPNDPRPGDDVFDVYSLAQGVGLNGIPYREW